MCSLPVPFLLPCSRRVSTHTQQDIAYRVVAFAVCLLLQVYIITPLTRPRAPAPVPPPCVPTHPTGMQEDGNDGEVFSPPVEVIPIGAPPIEDDSIVLSPPAELMLYPPYDMATYPPPPGPSPPPYYTNPAYPGRYPSPSPYGGPTYPTPAPYGGPSYPSPSRGPAYPPAYAPTPSGYGGYGYGSPAPRRGESQGHALMRRLTMACPCTVPSYSPASCCYGT